MADGIAIKLDEEAVRKSQMGERIKMRGELAVTAFSMRHASRGWQRELLFALPTEGRLLAWPTG